MTPSPDANPDLTQVFAGLSPRLASVTELPSAQALEVFTEIQVELHAALTDLNQT